MKTDTYLGKKKGACYNTPLRIKKRIKKTRPASDHKAVRIWTTWAATCQNQQSDSAPSEGFGFTPSWRVLLYVYVLLCCCLLCTILPLLLLLLLLILPFPFTFTILYTVISSYFDHFLYMYLYSPAPSSFILLWSTVYHYYVQGCQCNLRWNKVLVCLSYVCHNRRGDWKYFRLLFLVLLHDDTSIRRFDGFSNQEISLLTGGVHPSSLLAV